MNIVQLRLYNDSFCKLVIDTVSSVLDRNGHSASASGYYGNRLTAVTTKRKEKCMKLLIVNQNLSDYVLSPNLSLPEIHIARTVLS